MESMIIVLKHKGRQCCNIDQRQFSPTVIDRNQTVIIGLELKMAFHSDRLANFRFWSVFQPFLVKKCK